MLSPVAAKAPFTKGLFACPFQTDVEADQELGRVAHRAGLLHREDLRRVEASAADRNDERLSQLPYHLSGEYPD